MAQSGAETATMMKTPAGKSRASCLSPVAPAPALSESCNALELMRVPDERARQESFLTMSDTPDTPPDRLSTDPSSPFYNAEVLARDVGIRFKGVERNNIEEYCVSEGWVRMTAGNAKDRHGNPMTIKVSGPVEPYFRDKT
jgi:hypothetical protein